MKYFLFFGSLLIGLHLSAQNNRAPYLFRYEIDSILKQDTTPWKHQMAADDLSRIGAYSALLEEADFQYKGYGKRRALSAKDSTYVHSFHPIPARAYILKQAAREKVIIINEAHHQPLHRTFVTSLLRGLYARGYRYLGIETLGYTDSLLNQRKYPVMETGYYSKEPQYGNLIREALRVGFILFAYETTEDHNGKEREIDQAKNIARFMQQHPGKYLIHCGYAHVVEGSYPAWEKAMAGRLKEYTGINPLTIYQEALTEHSSPLYEQPDYPHIHFSQPAVLLHKEGAVYNGYARDSSYDIRLYHPRTRFVHGRPDWLSLRGTRKPYMIDAAKVRISYPVMALAYVAGEDRSRAVPYDIIEVDSDSDQKALFLEKGAYVIVLKNRQHETQEMNIAIR